MPRGHGASTMPVVQPTCQGHHPRSLAGEPWAPWHPFGGEIQPREARWGESGLVNHWRSPVVHPPRSGLPRKLGEHYLPGVLVVFWSSVPISPIFTSHIVDSFLPIACCRLQSSILSKIRPPEESPHRTRRAFRAESDSSTQKVVWRLVSGSF